jgi:hypothetical protein
MPAGAATVESPPVVVVSSPTTPLENDRAALRAMIHEELAADRAATAASRADAGREPARDDRPEPTLSNEQLKAYDRARTEVDRGIASGMWTEDDRLQLRASLATLPGETRIEIVRPLLVAVNARKVHFQGRGSLF